MHVHDVGPAGFQPITQLPDEFQRGQAFAADGSLEQVGAGGDDAFSQRATATQNGDPVTAVPKKPGEFRHHQFGTADTEG